MKKRNPLGVFILSLVTFGIYDIYWLVKTKTELNNKTRIHTPTIWLLFAPVIVMILAIILAAIMSHPTTAPGTMQPAGNAAGTLVLIIVYLLAFLVILPVTFYWFFKFSKAVNEYTGGRSSTGVTFLLLWLLHLIGVAVVQDTFNDMIDGGIQPGMPMQPGMAPQAYGALPPNSPMPGTAAPLPPQAPAAPMPPQAPPAPISPTSPTPPNGPVPPVGPTPPAPMA